MDEVFFSTTDASSTGELPTAILGSSTVELSKQDGGFPGVIEGAGGRSKGDRPHVRLSPGRRGLIAMVAIGLIAAVVTGYFMWQSQPVDEPFKAAPVGSGSDIPASVAPKDVVVAVSGAVNRPGLVHVPLGARVNDAIEAAGGLAPTARLGNLNVARKVVDGELVVVSDVNDPQDTSATRSNALPVARGTRLEQAALQAGS